ncbi:MAG: hypothetical protein KDD38_06255 [Bdellovibrionales bacterium]|nr:hypothetical protein [Bdellovibrionales bacterium]
MKCAEINISGFLFRVTCAEEKYNDIVDWLKDDFAACASATGLAGDTALSNRTGHTPTLISEIEINEFKRPKSLPIFWRPGLFVYKTKTSTYYSYNSDETKLEIVFGEKRHLKVFGQNIDKLHYIIYLSIISHLVETLEKEGWMPIHAFSASYKSKNFALIAPSGFGKSRLALKLMNDTEFQVFGDELAFIRNDELLPIPLRFAVAKPVLDMLGIGTKGLRPLFQDGRLHKITLPAPNERDVSPLRIDQLILVSNKSNLWRALSKKISGIDTWFMLLSAVGVPQMVQYLLRLNFIFRLPTIIYSRYKIMRSLENADLYFEVEGDPADISGLKEILLR